MNLRISVPLTLVAATAIGGFAAKPAQAQVPTTGAPAFYISEFEVTDVEGIKPYSARVESTFAPFGGKYVARGGHDRVSIHGASASLV